MSQSDNVEEKEEIEDSDDINIDDERPTLIQIDKKFSKSKKKEKNESMISLLKRKRGPSNDPTRLIYDEKEKKILNTFNPNLEEMENFLNNCDVRLFTSVDDLKQISFSENKLFDPEKFIKKNFENSSDRIGISSVEDIYLASTKDTEKLIKIIEEEKNDYIPNPKDFQIFLREIFKEKKISEPKKLNDIITSARKMDIKKIINKNNKLDIVFDLDNTCIFGKVLLLEEIKELMNKFKNKNICCIEFFKDHCIITSSLIIRNGLIEFINYAKNFCNFHISTLGIEPYGREIKKVLEKKLDNINIFKGFIARKDNLNYKLLKDLSLEKRNTIIFDDKPEVWKNERFNVILSKKFSDIEIERRQNISGFHDQCKAFLYNYYPFYFYKCEKNGEEIFWVNQKLLGGRYSPFYSFNYDDYTKNLCYSGEYLESSQKQFLYMKQLIKIIYYFVFHLDVQVPEALQLIRFNIFYNTYFVLKFYVGEGKSILKDIIENCGGKIIEGLEDKSENNSKIIIICKNEDYDKNKDKISKELIKYQNAKVTNERFVLDSFYFYTNLENEIDHPDYKVIKKQNKEDFYDFY